MKILLSLLSFYFMFALFSNNIATADQINSFEPIFEVAEITQTDSIRLTPQRWIEDTGQILTSPTNWNAESWNEFFWYGGLTYLTYKNDGHIQHWVQERRSKKTRDIAKIGNAFPAVGTIYLTGTYLLGDEKQRKFASTGLESVGIALFTTEVISLATKRERPDGTANSFPSSHTAAAFALATVISDEYGEADKAVPYLAYGLATLTAYGRLNDNKHWGSDVLAGALIGYYTAKTVQKINTSNNIKIRPYVDSDKKGVILSRKL